MHTGVYLSLRGVVYANNSVISITEIGVTNPDTNLNEGLQCITDRIPCCRRDFRTGEWYFPNRTMVSGQSNSPSFYRNRGMDDGTVNLNRINANVMMPTGLFCCKVPDGTGIVQTVCVTIILPPNPEAISQEVDFQLISSQNSMDVSFSLTCNSSGGPVSSVTWIRDGFLLGNTGPVVLTDASTASYTNVLEVNSRAPGTYTCQIRGPSHQVLSSMDFNVQGVIRRSHAI